jgi:hypothetical protein
MRIAGIPDPLLQTGAKGCYGTVEVQGVRRPAKGRGIFDKAQGMRHKGLGPAAVSYELSAMSYQP